MSKLNVNKIKESLIKERNLILSKLRDNDLSIDESETPDPVDLAARNYSKNLTLAVSENESKKLDLIYGALEKLKGDEYGFCQNCEGKINSKRLDAVPWAQYCIACQERKEKGLLEEEM